jgi:hypothetical protein
MKTKNYSDYVMRQRYAGGKFFRVELEVHLGIDESDYATLGHQFKPWASKYRYATHIKCKLLKGDAYEYRYGSRGNNVCSGLFGLLDIPEPSMPVAEKIIKAMNMNMATQAEVQPF